MSAKRSAGALNPYQDTLTSLVAEACNEFRTAQPDLDDGAAVAQITEILGGIIVGHFLKALGKSPECLILALELEQASFRRMCGHAIRRALAEADRDD